MTVARSESMVLPFAIAASLHVILLILLTFHFRSHVDLPKPDFSAPVIQAKAIDMRQFMKQKVKQPEPVVEPQQEPEPVVIPPEVVPETPPVDLREQQLREKQQEQAKAALDAAEKKRQAELTEKLALEIKKKKDEAARKKQEEIAKKKALEEQAIKRKADEDEKKARDLKLKQEDERKQKELADKKRQVEEDKKRKEAEAKKRAQEESELAEQMDTDAQQSAARQKFIQTEFDKYRSLIFSKIQRYWLVPANPIGSCLVKVRLGPGGIVLDVDEGKGDAVLCRSVVVAVRKAEPLPVSSDPDVFNELRDMNVTMDPKNKIQ